MTNATIETPTIPQPVLDAVTNGVLSHVAIIMDGNRRWAKQRDLKTIEGHYNGYQALKTLLTYCACDLHLPVLTVYAFSTENWHRDITEVDPLLALFEHTLTVELPTMMRDNVKLRLLGNLNDFSESFQRTWQHAEQETSKNTGLIFQVALNYGGRTEIADACQTLAQQVQAGTLAPEDITQELIGNHLYSTGIVDPDLVIRTSGEYRLSNFLAWQSAYAELYIDDDLWPDFTPQHLNKAILEFLNRKRRFGK